MALILTIFLTTMEILGIISAIVALFYGRTSQGSIAWIVSLLTIPYIAVPLYWIFGRTKFHGYVIERKSGDSKLEHIVEKIRQKTNWKKEWPPDLDRLHALEELAKLDYTPGNRAKLLIDGENTFNDIFDGIEQAQEFILVQFFIIRDDVIGTELKKRLVEKAQQGLIIYFLYDEIGCNKLPHSYLDDLEQAGVHVSSFHSTRGHWNRFQLNFRNHRKIVVTDGTIGWLGGHNVGDEYLGKGKNKKLRPWRDTHIRLEGPAVAGMVLSFIEDWHWATDEHIELDWQTPQVHKDGHTAIIVPSGPADDYETASLMIQQIIQAAKERIWISSPYFVPDEGVQHALHLAALRGVDVRILIPDRPDHILPYMSAFAFVGDMINSGVKIHRYTKGFLHQKAFLVDFSVGAISTVNLDNRSFRLNFEITAIVFGSEFAKEVEGMLKTDFANSYKMLNDDIKNKPVWFKLASRAAYLAAPVQ